MRARVEYDGTNYRGFQIQSAQPSVQRTLARAVREATGTDVRISGAGRTDSGAHAWGQVVAFDVETRLTDARLLQAVNAHLPSDIALHSAETVDSSFDPRRQAVSREYHYLVLNQPTRSPLWRHRAYHFPGKLCIGDMSEAASHLVGTHDFSTFAKPSKEEPVDPRFPRSPVRTLYACGVDPREEIVQFRFIGSGFMRHMIRTMVGTLLEVGRGTRRIAEISGVLEARDRSQAAKPVPALGLYLVKVNYEMVAG